MRNRKHDIEKYLRGELSPHEMHALERAALSDPFLAEALEGVEHAGADNFLYDLHQINRSVSDRMGRKSRKKARTIRIWGWTSAVAATVLLISVSGFMVVHILRQQESSRPQQSVASEKSPAVTADSGAVAARDTTLLALESRPQEEKPSPSKDQPKSARQEPPAAALAQESPAPEVSTGEVEALASAEDDRATLNEVDAVDGQQARHQDTIAEREIAALARVEETESRAPAGAERRDKKAVSRALEGQVAGVQRAQAEIPALAAPMHTISGKVTSEDGHGMPGVSVTIPGTGSGVVTDAEGHFELSVPENHKLSFSFIGFESQEIAPQGTELNVVMEEDISALSEVVVTGFGGDTRSDNVAFRPAEPDGGKNDFKNYLANAVRYPQEAIKNKIQGKVTVRFTVEPNGKLTDFEVLKGIGSGCEEELIRAIQQGPYWKPGARGEQPVKEKVRVRFKFNLPQ